ncbi:MAG TPA: hypothetical protein VK186_14695 [Candidatus Deferrimicrobium sp.]|nr:hypothetical protein [Candidatus Deferrimicrobium sp.]
MENSRGTLLIILSISLVYLSCSKKEEKADFFNDEDLHFVLYTNPSSDCIDCIHKALKALNTNSDKGESIYVFIKPSQDKERFINYLKSEFPLKAIKFIDHTLNAPSPAIILMRKENVYMWLYIQNDPFQFNL